MLIHRTHGIDIPFEVRTSSRDGHTELKVSKTTSKTETVANGDVIRKVGGQKVANRLQYELALLDQRAGSAIEIEYEHAGQSKIERIEGASRLTSSVSLVSARNQEQSNYAWNVLGVRLRAADAQQVRAVDASYSGGLLIESVRKNSPAHNAKLQSGDVLVGLLEWQTPNWKISNWIFNSEEMKQARSPKFRIIRSGGVFYGTFGTE